MSEIDDLLESLDNQEDYDNKLIEIIKELRLQIPILDERKRERDAKRFFMENAPHDFLIEIAPKLLQIEKGDEEKLSSSIPGLLHGAELTKDAYYSTGSTASPYVAEAYNYIVDTDQPASWFKSVAQPFDDLAEYKSQKANIPSEVDRIYQGLGDMFSEALKSVETARKDLGNLSVSVMAMRNFIQSLWGNILDMARQTKPNLWDKIQKGRLGQSDVQHLVSKSVCNNPNNERKMILLLDEMSNLYNDMSSNQVGKNLKFDNKSLLDALFTRWLLLIDGLIKIV